MSFLLMLEVFGQGSIYTARQVVPPLLKGFGYEAEQNHFVLRITLGERIAV
ncbi:MAG TPA: hypothetical protein VFI95_06815 [Terriglobales bacterium]|nr:hypothetical protein [Terriglobales bacterium]